MHPRQSVSQLLTTTQMLATRIKEYSGNIAESEVQSIRQSFDKTIDQLRQDLYTYDDGCPNTHFEKFSHYNPDENQFVFCALAGHPLVCS